MSAPSVHASQLLLHGAAATPLLLGRLPAASPSTSVAGVVGMMTAHACVVKRGRRSPALSSGDSCCTVLTALVAVEKRAHCYHNHHARTMLNLSSGACI